MTRLITVFIGTLTVATLTGAAMLPQPPATPAAATPADQPAPQERVAAIKKSFAESQAALRKYEWIETTIVSLRGEEKSRKQNRCYYGEDGKLQKVLISTPPPPTTERGLRGRIKEQKKEELAEYMEEATALVHKYLPPDHEKIQKCVDAGKASIRIIEPGKRAKLDFKDYQQPGDMLSVEIDLMNNRVLNVNVSTALGKDKDPVTLDVRFDKLTDGTIYAAESNLEAKAKNVKVIVQNSGYRKAGT
ncbi:MAG: hypothetical protein ACREJO_09780 [Phycisphaerales bacterium]